KKDDGELKPTGYQVAGQEDSWWSDWAYWFALQALLDLFLEETDSEGEDLTGAVQIFPTDVIDQNPTSPTINDYFGPYLNGTFQGGGIIQFKDDRFYFSKSFPSSVNDSFTSILRFYATGASVDYSTSFNAIILDSLVGGIPGNYKLEFLADRGGIKSIYTDLIHAGPIEMHTFGTYPDEGHIDIWDTVI